VYSDRSLPTLRRNMLPPSSVPRSMLTMQAADKPCMELWRRRRYVPPKCW
jgi:hypothetical protein